MTLAHMDRPADPAELDPALQAGPAPEVLPTEVIIMGLARARLSDHGPLHPVFGDAVTEIDRASEEHTLDYRATKRVQNRLANAKSYAEQEEIMAEEYWKGITAPDNTRHREGCKCIQCGGKFGVEIVSIRDEDMRRNEDEVMFPNGEDNYFNGVRKP